MSEESNVDIEDIPIEIGNTIKVTNSKQQIYVAWDIESSGPGFQHPVVAVGVCYGTISAYRKKRWYLDFDTKDFDATCYEEFWSKNLDLLNNIKKDAVPQEQGWKSISTFLTELEQQHPKSRIVVCSDNPAFDLTLMDYNLYKYCNRLGVRYSDKGKYRQVMDPTEQRRFHPQKDLLKKRLYESGARHTHNPDDDAEGIYMQQVMLESPKILSGEKNFPKLLE